MYRKIYMSPPWWSYKATLIFSNILGGLTKPLTVAFHPPAFPCWPKSEMRCKRCTCVCHARIGGETLNF